MNTDFDDETSGEITSETITGTIVGTHFRQPHEKECYATLSAGDTVTLIREPENQYDPMALKVMFLANHVGYIARDIAASISYQMDEVNCTTTTGVLTTPHISRNVKHWEVEVNMDFGTDPDEEYFATGNADDLSDYY